MNREDELQGIIDFLQKDAQKLQGEKKILIDFLRDLIVGNIDKPDIEASEVLKKIEQN